MLTSISVIIAMEFAENGTILDRLHAAKYLNEPEARKYFLELISALRYLHSKDIAHRDLKLENLLLDTKFVLKLSDFGFARKVSGLMEMSPTDVATCLSNTFCGSAAYASPEILTHLPYDPKQSDVWASGVILYAMVYGRLPFNDTSLPLLLKSMKNGAQFPSESSVSIECKNMLQKLMAPLSSRIKTEKISHEQINWLWIDSTKCQ